VNMYVIEKVADGISSDIPAYLNLSEDGEYCWSYRSAVAHTTEEFCHFLAIRKLVEDGNVYPQVGADYRLISLAPD